MMIPLDITLLDNFGITWVRQRCRCCGAILWEVLGDRVGLCRRCDEMHSDPIGVLRIDRDTEYLHRIHTRQYHGACALDV